MGRSIGSSPICLSRSPAGRGDSGWDQFLERHVEMHLSALWIDMDVRPRCGFQRGPVVRKRNFHNPGYNISSRRIDQDTVQSPDRLTLVIFDDVPNKRIFIGLLDSTLGIRKNLVISFLIPTLRKGCCCQHNVVSKDNPITVTVLMRSLFYSPDVKDYG
jgi:hypothetical protein